MAYDLETLSQFIAGVVKAHHAPIETSIDNASDCVSLIADGRDFVSYTPIKLLAGDSHNIQISGYAGNITLEYECELDMRLGMINVIGRECDTLKMSECLYIKHGRRIKVKNIDNKCVVLTLPECGDWPSVIDWCISSAENVAGELLITNAEALRLYKYLLGLCEKKRKKQIIKH